MKAPIILLQLGLLLMFPSSSLNSSLQCSLQDLKTLYILSLAPFPDDRPGFDPRYSGSGEAGILPAVQLAIKNVNHRTDLLCGFKLDYISADSGCEVSSKAIESILEHVFMSSKQVVGIVGPVCSTAATAVAALLARPEVSLLHFTTALSPGLLNMKYVNTIKALGTSKVFVDAFLHLVKSEEWNTVGSFFEDDSEEFRLAHDTFQKVMLESNRTVLSSPITASHLDFDLFTTSRARIIFIFATSKVANEIMCLSHEKYFNVTYPTYQWIIPAKHQYLSELEATTFHLEGQDYSCSEEEVKEAYKGSIMTTIHIDTQCEQCNYTNYEENVVETSAANTTRDPNANVYYDGVWAFALALNRSIKPLEDQGYNLSQYTLGHNTITDTIRKEMLKLDFNGASARIHFDNVTNERKPQLDFFRVEEQNIVKIGFYNTLEENLTIYEGIELIDDEFPREVNKIHPAIGIVVLILTAIVLTLTVLLHVLTTAYREVKTIKATSPNLNHLIFSGCYLFITVTIVLISHGSLFLHTFNVDKSESEVTHGVLCSVTGWCVSMGYSLVFGTVLVKSIRIYTFFTRFKNHSGFLLTDSSLTICVVLFLLADIVLNISWNVVAPWTIEQGKSIVGHKVLIEVHCECDYELVWLAVLVALKIVLTAAVLYCSILTRRIKRKEFKHSKNINILAYSLAFLYAMGIPILAVFHSNLYGFTLTICALSLGTVTLCQVTLFIRPFYILYCPQFTIAKHQFFQNCTWRKKAFKHLH